MLILSVLKRDLRLFFQRCELICVHEHQMHQSLHVDLYFDLVFFFQVLIFSLFVAQFSFLVFELLLAHHPEITDADTLVIVHVGQLVFMLNLTLESPTLYSERLFKVFIDNIVNCICQRHCILPSIVPRFVRHVSFEFSTDVNIY